MMTFLFLHRRRVTACFSAPWPFIIYGKIHTVCNSRISLASFSLHRNRPPEENPSRSPAFLVAQTRGCPRGLVPLRGASEDDNPWISDAIHDANRIISNRDEWKRQHQNRVHTSPSVARERQRLEYTAGLGFERSPTVAPEPVLWPSYTALPGRWTGRVLCYTVYDVASRALVYRPTVLGSRGTLSTA